MKFTIIIEQSTNNFAAYAPDLPGCVATGQTRDQTVDAMQAAIELHIQSLRENGEPVPAPSCTVAEVDIAA